MAIDPRQPYLAARCEQPLLRLEQHPQPGAGDVFESAAIQRHHAFDSIEKGLRARRFGCIQASGDDDAAVHKINRKHSLRLYLRRARKWAIPIVFFET